MSCGHGAHLRCGPHGRPGSGWVVVVKWQPEEVLGRTKCSTKAWAAIRTQMRL